MSILLTLGLLVLSFVLSELLRPKPQIENERPAGIGDFRFPTATQSRSVPLIWGTVMIDGPNVVWYGDLKQVAIKEKIKTGMFSSKRVVVGFKYYLGVQFALCRGEIDNIRQVQIGEKEVFSGSQGAGVIAIDEPNLFGGDKLGRGGIVGDLRVHVGSKTQAVNSYLTNHQAINGATPRYSGTCYLVFEQGYVGNSTSIDPWKFEVRRIPNGLGLGTPGVNSGNDANPMNVIYEILTNQEWGLKFPAADIDTSNFTTAASTLATEGNGFSMVLDRPISAGDLIHEVERQIDGVVYLDPATGKWKVKLVRNDYNIDTVPQLNKDNLKAVEDFSRGAWTDTTNHVKVQFNNRERSYTEDFATAQDMANMMIQGGGSAKTGINVSAQEVYPGVKDAALANAIAWRDIRPLSYPIAKATFVVDRTFWDITPGQVVAWTDEERGFVKLPMRVQRIERGELTDNAIKLACVQDVFQFGAGVFGDPDGGNWTPPDDSLSAFDSDKRFAMEAPRKIVFIDPEYSGMTDKIWAFARQKGNEVAFKIMERHSTGTPSGDYSEAGEVYGFILMGKLKTTLEAGTAIPTTSILVTADPDTQTAIVAAFENVDIVDQGKYMHHLIMVDDEFMLPRSAQTSGSDIQLNNVYRGVMDGGHRKHNGGAYVWLLFVGAGLADVTIPDPNNVDIKLLPFSIFDEVAIGDATAISFQMDDRIIRPYPPSRLSLNGSVFPSSASLDYVAGGAEATGMDLDFIRRSFRTADGGDEIAALTTDAASIFSDYPTLYSTEHLVEVWNDPDGTPTLLFIETGITGTTKDILRLKILKETDGVVPSRMRLLLKSEHTYEGSVFQSSRGLRFDFNTTSALSSDFNFGALDTDDVSNTYTADADGQHDFVLSSAFTAGDVEYRLNGGGWTQLIAGGGTTGNIAGVVTNDTIEVRHKSTDSSALKQLTMTAPGSGTDGYAVLYT